MSLTDISEIVAATLVSAGGIGAIITGVVAFSTNQIARRLNKKFELTIDKKFERYKSDLSKKEYVSKTRFDTEFTLYRTLSLDFSEMIRSINILIPSGYAIIPADNNERLKYEEKCYNRALPTVDKAQNTLNSNIPFISEKIYEGYNELIKLANSQLSEYQSRNIISDLRPQEEKERFTMEAYIRTKELNNKWRELNNEIREYITSLDVIAEKR